MASSGATATTSTALGSSGVADDEHRKGGGGGEIVEEIPPQLKRLVLFLVGAFFAPEHMLVMRYLVQLECVKEDDLRNLLRLEIKYLRAILLQLRQDKLVREKQGTEDDPSAPANRPKKINYYFPNWRAIISLVKYKVDHMRIRLESREKDEVHKAQYKCKQCAQHYDAMDMDKIFDPFTDTMKCWRCGGAVEDDAEAAAAAAEALGDKKETRHSLTKFNEQMAVVFSMVKQLEGIRLAPQLLEPPLNTKVALLLERSNAGGAGEASAAAAGSGGPNQSAGANPSGAAGGGGAKVAGVGEKKFSAHDPGRSELFQPSSTIAVDIDTSANGDGGAHHHTKQKAAVPWLHHVSSLEESAAAAASLMGEVGTSGPPPTKMPRMDEREGVGLGRAAGNVDEEDRKPAPLNSPSSSFAKPVRDHRTTEEQFADLLADEFETVGTASAAEGKREPSPQESTDDYVRNEHSHQQQLDSMMVTVQGTSYRLEDVTTELLEQMTEEERTHYVRLTEQDEMMDF